MDGDINPDWMDVDNSGANRIGGNVFDFDGVTPGVYTFRATTNNSVPPCGQESYDFEVTVRDCNCPSVLLTEDTIALCKSAPFHIDLSPISVNADPGTWSVPPGQPAGLFFSGNELNYAAC
jgi:hypothetical protein